MKKRWIALVVMVSLVLAACGGGGEKPAGTATEAGGAQAASGDTVHLRASQPVAPTHPYHLGLVKFAELIDERTEGKVKIDIFHSGQLGNERDNIEGLQMGTLDIAVSSTGPMGTFVKDFQMLDLPFLFQDYAEADKVLDGEVGEALLAKLSDLGIVGAAFWENGFREITTSDSWGPIQKLEDLKGLKIRTQENEVHMKSFSALGADPTPMAFSEVFTSLQTGVLDAQENPVPIIYNNKLYEVQKNLSMTNHFYSPALIMFSKASFDKLDADTQKIFMDTAKEVAIYERDLNRTQEKDQMQELKDAGMNIVEVDTAPFRAAVQSVYDEYQPHFDANLMKILLGE